MTVHFYGFYGHFVKRYTYCYCRLALVSEIFAKDYSYYYTESYVELSGSFNPIAGN